MTRYKDVLLVFAATGALGFGSVAARSEVVGTAGAVNPASVGVEPSGPTRVIEIGAQVVHRERIRTSDKGSVQLVFIDKTSLNIGPNSDLLIDEFVFDPNTSSGRMVATLAKGALRFVGGGTSHTGGATISTPAATIGIRGGVGSISHAAQDGTLVIHHFGLTTVTTKTGETQTIRRPDFSVRVKNTGESTSPARVGSDDLASMTGRLTSLAGQTGGALRRPTDQLAAQAGLGTTTRSLVPSATPGIQAQTTASPRRTNTQAELQPHLVAQAIRQGSQGEASRATAQQVQVQMQVQVQVQDPREQPPPPVVSSQDPPPTTKPPSVGPAPGRRFYALGMSIDPSLGSGAPYLPAGFAAAGAFYNSPVLGVGVGGTGGDGTPNRQSGLLQAGLNITGQGLSQTSTIYLMTGAADSAGFNSFDGGFVATTRRRSDFSAGLAFGTLGGTGTDVSFDADDSPTSIRLTQDGVDGSGGRIPSKAYSMPQIGASGTEYTLQQTASRTGTPTSLGANRPETVLSGFAAGLMQTFSRNSGSAIGDSFPFLAGAGVAFLQDTRLSAVIGGSNQNSNGETTGELDSALLKLGYQGSGSLDSRGVYVDYDNFGARESRTATLSSLSTVNDQPVSDSHALMVTSRTVNAAAAFPGVTFCQCEYTRWGFWSSETQRDLSGDRFQDILHLGTWVAGQVTSPADMPVSGSAVYQGHVIAAIKASGSEYMAAGNFYNAVNFGSRLGTINITGLDSRNYTGDVTIPPSSNAFGGTLNGTGAGGPTMLVTGQFFNGPAGPAQEMGGLVSIDGGASYMGAGTFAATRH